MPYSQCALFLLDEEGQNLPQLPKRAISIESLDLPRYLRNAIVTYHSLGNGSYHLELLYR